jgi:anhydro-N-acetylmuramic acid kinase
VAGLFIGLMSGTSLDGVDGVLADFSQQRPRVLAHAGAPFDATLRAELFGLQASGTDELHRAALAGNALVRVYAQVVRQLLEQSGRTAADIRAIGAHGQTVRHRPQQHDGTGYTLQINQPALLAELTGIDVAADFRSRDVAAGGQGAPLAPFFHRAMFAREGVSVGVLNLGGISNLSVLRGDGSLLGFDCGPANALMDFWCERHRGEPFDRDGQWAASGKVDAALLASMLREPYFAQQPPKSTGRDLFNPEWLDRHLADRPGLQPQDVQCTLAELTARCCAEATQRHAGGIARLVVCGGGALNRHLMLRLQKLLPSAAVVSSEAEGLPPQQVEGAAFAWLAMKTVSRQPLELKSTTGARGARVLGAVWPA